MKVIMDHSFRGQTSPQSSEPVGFSLSNIQQKSKIMFLVMRASADQDIFVDDPVIAFETAVLKHVHSRKEMRVEFKNGGFVDVVFTFPTD